MAPVVEHLRTPVDLAAGAPDADATTLTIVHLSDTHNRAYADVPFGDILVHTGDFTDGGSEEEVLGFNRWLRAQPHPVKIVVPGNHDGRLECVPYDKIRSTMFKGVPGECHLLIDTGVTIAGVNFFGLPWTDCAGWGYYAPRGPALAAKWDTIPDDTHVLLTHQPPFSVLDTAWGGHSTGPAPRGACETCGRDHPGYAHWGCPALEKTVTARLPHCALHCFGHVHDDVGVCTVQRRGGGPTLTYSNAAMDLTPRCNVFDIRIARPGGTRAAVPTTPFPLDARPPAAKPGRGWAPAPAPPPPRAAGGAGARVPPPPPPPPPSKKKA